MSAGALHAPGSFAALASELGLRAHRTNDRSTWWSGRGFDMRPEGGWLVLVGRRPGLAPGSTARDLVGAPGPWRLQPRAHSPVEPGGAGEAGERVVCELPWVRGLGAGLDAAGLSALLDWASATHSGTPGWGWCAPERADVEAWIDLARLSVPRGGPVGPVGLVRGELVRTEKRLAFVFDDLGGAPCPVDSPRRAWLDALLDDAARRWRLVRFAVVHGGDDAGRVRAEVDLSGVPAPLARPLVRLSFDALLWAVGWVLPSLSFVADPGSRSRALEGQPTTTSKRSST